MNVKFDFTDSNAIITGAGTGIGRQTAIRMAKNGANVFLVGRRDKKLAEVCDFICSEGGNASYISADISSKEDVKRVYKGMAECFGNTDILINAAGVSTPLSVTKAMSDAWKTQIDINLNGTAYMCAGVLEQMKEAGYGRIVNIASVNAFITSKTLERHAYNASKAGVCGLTRGLSSTYAGSGITVNAICPGLFESEMTEEIFANKFVMATFNKQVPIGRAGHLEEVVDAIMFLASKNSSYITGQCLAVDGGMSVSSFL